MNLKEIQKKFNKIETKNIEVFRNKVSSVYFWKLLRLDIRNQLVNYFSDYKTNSVNSLSERLKRIIEWVIDDIKIIYFKDRKCKSNSNVAVFDSGRYVPHDEGFIDLHTYFIKRELQKQNEVIVFNPDIINQQKKYNIFPNYALPIKSIRKIREMFFRPNIDSKTKKLLEKIQQDFFIEFNVKIDLFRMVKKAVKRFIIHKKYYQKLMSKLSLKEVYLVCSYGKEPLISTCKELNIKVIELQHGVINDYHMGYSFPLNKVEYFPDQILFFGRYWFEKTKIPLLEDNKIVKGYPYLTESISNYSSVKKQKDSLLILTQGNNTKKIIEFLRDFIHQNRFYTISIKLHPSEYIAWESKYPEILSWVKNGNVEIINNIKDTLHLSLAKNEKVLGVYSTAIYEALAFGCQCYILNLSGNEYLENLIKDNVVNFIESKSNIDKILKLKSIKHIDINNIFFN